MSEREGETKGEGEGEEEGVGEEEREMERQMQRESLWSLVSDSWFRVEGDLGFGHRRRLCPILSRGWGREQRLLKVAHRPPGHPRDRLARVDFW